MQQAFAKMVQPHGTMGCLTGLNRPNTSLEGFRIHETQGAGHILAGATQTGEGAMVGKLHLVEEWTLQGLAAQCVNPCTLKTP